MNQPLDPLSIKLDTLSQSLQDMAVLIGLPGTMKLVEHYGGVRMYVPKDMAPDHLISKLIGFDNALKLSQEFGGLPHVEIPRALGALRHIRDVEIAEKYSKGKSARQLAYEYRMTERNISNIVSRAGIQTEDRQAGLF